MFGDWLASQINRKDLVGKTIKAINVAKIDTSGKGYFQIEQEALKREVNVSALIGLNLANVEYEKWVQKQNGS